MDEKKNNVFFSGWSHLQQQGRDRGYAGWVSIWPLLQGAELALPLGVMGEGGL